jgi:Ca2+-transporting ATPase
MMTDPKTDLPWFQKTSEEALRAQHSHDKKGLRFEQVDRRRRDHGLNKLDDVRKKSSLGIFFAQFADLLVLLLVGAATVAFFLGNSGDIIAIVGIILMNALLGFFQEYKAERAMDELRALTAPTAKVIREGGVHVVSSHELVPGDLVLLEVGSLVPADVRILEAHHFQVDESMLTGESLPIEKSSQEIRAEVLALSDQVNMAFKGTLVRSGRARGLVVRTGMKTELGRIAKLLKEEVEVKTPLQVRIKYFAQILSIVVIALCAVLFFMGLMRGEEPILMFMTALSLAVAAIPEALPAVVTMALAIGARVMGRQKALIRKLPAVESLGAVTYICTDKTGTLTENRMSLEQIVTAEGSRGSMQDIVLDKSPSWPHLERALILNNDAIRDERGEWHGDPTEIALVSAPFERGVDIRSLREKFPRLAEISFSSERSMMTTVHRFGGDEEKFLILTKGAPERVISQCYRGLSDRPLNVFDLDRIQQIADELAEKGYRVLAFAQRQLQGSLEQHPVEDFERDLVFIGLVGLMDPPRAGVKEAVQQCQRAGIRIVMITGDHPKTAQAIAQRLGIVFPSTTGSKVEGAAAPRDFSCDAPVTGVHLALWSEEELFERVLNIKVFARVAPEQKIRIVRALQKKGAIVAMTGDGVNDAPALRGADVGIAMGQKGTDVAREASHMILMDDHFATIVHAVGEGRKIYDNVRKFIRFALSGNSGEIWTLIVAPFLGLPTPLLPIHILWINLVTDGLPGLALAFEPAEPQVMERPPRSPRESIFARGLWQHSVWVGILSAAVTLGTLAWAISQKSPHWQTMAFTVLTLVQMGHVLAIRSETESFIRWPLRKNPMMLGAVLITFSLQLIVIYVPFCQKFFSTTPLTPMELFLCLGMSSTVFVAVEIEKWWRRRKTLKGKEKGTETTSVLPKTKMVKQASFN